MQLRRSSVSALAEVAKHGPSLAQAVIDANVLPLIVPLITHIDARLKRQVRSHRKSFLLSTLIYYQCAY